MDAKIRKIVTYLENTLIEGGRAAPRPLQLFGVAAVLDNPWAGRGFVEDLKPEIHAIAPVLGELLTARDPRARRVGRSGRGLRQGRGGRHGGRGRACLGAHPHAAFRQPLSARRSAPRAISASPTRAAVPTRPIVIPLMHKHDEGMRSHYLTVQFSILDAPAPDEIVVALGASIGGRPHHRIGDRYQDLKELGGMPSEAFRRSA